MAAGVPALAGFATFMAQANDTAFYGSPSERLFRAATVFFIVLSAGNGYLMTIAIGDLGRSIIALPIGALAGFVSVYAAHSPAAMKLVIAYLALVTFVAARDMGRELIHDAAEMIIALIILLCFVSAGNNNSLLVAYPLACSLIAASMPLYGGLEGIFSAMVVGIRASLIGSLAGVMVLIVLSPVWASQWDWLRGITVVLCAMAANVYCFKHLFEATYRATVDAEKPEIPKVVANGAALGEPAVAESIQVAAVGERASV